MVFINLKKYNFQTIYLYLILFFVISNCTRLVPTKEGLHSVDWDDIYVGDDLSKDSLKLAIHNSIDFLKTRSSKEQFEYGNLMYTSREIIQSMELFLEILTLNDALFKKNLEKKFILFKPFQENTTHTLFTGYYEPVYEGSKKKSKEFSVPVYKLPNNLQVLSLGKFRPNLGNQSIVYRLKNNQILPYYSRKEIMVNKVLKNKNLEVAWMKSPIDLFFLQIQGSGILKLQNGEEIRLAYSGANGRPYSSIGSLLIDQNKIKKENMSMQSIQEYLKKYPEETTKVLTYNKSYTFFKELKATKQGPNGNLNVPLTPKRSIATDYLKFPKAALTYMITKAPNCDDTGMCKKEDKQLNRFALNQDTGGAIRGYSRADLFWGRGILEESSAGRMNHRGSLYFLIAKKQFLKVPNNIQH